jgi:hypothetical protein
MLLKNLFKILLPIDSISSILKSPYFCRHEMAYYDMIWKVDDELSSHFYERFNNKIWKDTLCYCHKCGVKKKMSMKVGEWGKWRNDEFTIPKSGKTVTYEIYEIGRETRKQKRDRLISKLLNG